jgi:serine/threonine-protein kinase
VADESVATERLGSLVDERYKLLDVMASGAMGAVYKAERVPVGKLVAVKFLHASFANDSEFQARFERETRVMSKLAHPNCVSVLDFGVWKNHPYLVMDFVAGTTLRARLDKGPIEPVRALQIARQIAAGLAHAHEQGVFHRDIKPANIMITEEIGHGERVRILDFGLARLRGNVGRDATQTNMVVGTPNYMSPEQTVPGGNIDARSDIYSLGVVLYEMVVGERPFQAEDTLQLLGMHRAAPIPRLVDRVKDGVELPVKLQDLIDTAMAKAPADRYQTAIELADAIDDVLGGKPEPMRKLESVRVKRPPGATAAGLAPTMPKLDGSAPASADDTVSEPHEIHEPTHSRFLPAMISLMIGVGVALTAYFLHRNAEQSDSELKKDARAGSGASIASGTGSSETVAADADQIAMIAPEDALAAEPDAALADAAEAVADAAVGSNAGSGSADEIEMDPNKAEDLDPQKGSAATAEDEAADAPKTKDEAEQHASPAAPILATNLHDAVQLIKDGKHTEALNSLRALAKKSPKSAYIPFLLGNLYFDQQWWGVALDHYAEAIKKNAEYRQNPVINRNVIKMLGSNKTQQRATNFLRGTIGHPAAYHLRWAAKNEQSSLVRQRAANLAKVIH